MQSRRVGLHALPLQQADQPLHQLVVTQFVAAVKKQSQAPLGQGTALSGAEVQKPGFGQVLGVEGNDEGVLAPGQVAIVFAAEGHRLLQQAATVVVGQLQPTCQQGQAVVQVSPVGHRVGDADGIPTG
ncbi:MAG: hypothetical protein EBX50_22460, partial [Chitinophagia bacterium]|nr:hypothetical protein [Chitinophagia bacterium]